MEEISVKLNLPEGEFQTKVLAFDKSDKEELYEIYNVWRSLCSSLTSMKSRAVNLPEGLSEGAFCIAMDAVRIINPVTGANTSFDCYNIKSGDRIQVKGCSILPDLTSFGPKSVWDKIYFVDFFKDGKWDGTFDIYLIDNDDIYNHKVNANQTMKNQQEQGRRPRFSIFSDIIKKKKLIPIKTYSLKP